LQGQLERNTAQGRELRRKQRGYQSQVRALLDERADCQAQLQEQQRELMNLRQRLGLAQKENEDLLQAEEEDRPRFTTTELRDILSERNELKARVSDLEDELNTYRSVSPSPAPE
jgi:chromosome segregation ATPase